MSNTERMRRCVCEKEGWKREGERGWRECMIWRRGGVVSLWDGGRDLGGWDGNLLWMIWQRGGFISDSMSMRRAIASGEGVSVWVTTMKYYLRDIYISDLLVRALVWALQWSKTTCIFFGWHAQHRSAASKPKEAPAAAKRRQELPLSKRLSYGIGGWEKRYLTEMDEMEGQNRWGNLIYMPLLSTTWAEPRWQKWLCHRDGYMSSRRLRVAGFRAVCGGLLGQ